MRLCKDGIWRPIPPIRNRIDSDEWFWKRVAKRTLNECWEWKGHKGKKKLHNYGQVCFDGAPRLTHRLAWIFTFGLIPKGKHVLHKCDNPPCCNPNHLFLGTHLDNMRDAQIKGRSNCTRGEARFNSVLKAKDVREIRKRYQRMSRKNGGNALAKRYGVHHTVINQIIHGQLWKHIK